MATLPTSAPVSFTHPSTSILPPSSRPPPLPPAPSADELHLALSHVVFRREYRPPSPPAQTDVPPASDKHLELLNLLSLLLVTQAKGDVAAVMFRVLSQNTLELHYAKNRPCTADEKAYINDILAIVRDAAANDVHVTCWKLLSLVIPKCKRKMKSRAAKICDQLEKLSVDPQFWMRGDACTLASETALREAVTIDVFPANISLPQFVHGWFTHLLAKPDPPFAKWHTGYVYQMLHLAYCIGHAPDISRVLDAKLLARVRKLGDYYGAALTMISDAANLPAAQFRHLKIVEVVPTPPRSVSVRANFVDTVNAWARHTGELEVSERALRLVSCFEW